MGAPTPKVGVLTYFLAENCMKIKEEFGPPRWGACPWRRPYIRHCMLTTQESILAKISSRLVVLIMGAVVFSCELSLSEIK